MRCTKMPVANKVDAVLKLVRDVNFEFFGRKRKNGPLSIFSMFFVCCFHTDPSYELQLFRQFCLLSIIFAITYAAHS